MMGTTCETCKLWRSVRRGDEWVGMSWMQGTFLGAKVVQSEPQTKSAQMLETEICKWQEVEMFPTGCSELLWSCLEAQHFSQGLEDQNAQALAAMETALFAIDGLGGFGQHEVLPWYFTCQDVSSLFNIQTLSQSQSLRKKLRSNQKKNAAVHFQLRQVFIPTISAKESLHPVVGIRPLRPEPVRQFIWMVRPFCLEWQSLASIVGRYTSNICKNVAHV